MDRAGSPHTQHHTSVRISRSCAQQSVRRDAGEPPADAIHRRVVHTVEETLSLGRPEIFNTDQGNQFTAVNFTSRLESCGITISIDSRGRALDNVFIERLWRSVKYEEVYRCEYPDGWAAEESLARSFEFYCERRIHQSLGDRTPASVYAIKDSSEGGFTVEDRDNVSRITSGARQSDSLRLPPQAVSDEALGGPRQPQSPHHTSHHSAVQRLGSTSNSMLKVRHLLLISEETSTSSFPLETIKFT